MVGSILGGAATSLIGGALGGLGGGSSGDSGPREFNATNNLFDIIFNKTKGPDQVLAQAKGPLLDFQNQQLEGAGLFGDMAQNNDIATLASQLGGDFLGNLSAFDPAQIADQQFSILAPILQREFDKQNLSQENRLFSQGQLFGTPGIESQRAQLGQQDDQRRKLLFDSFGQGLAAQQQQVNIGSQLTQLDPALRGLFQNLSSANLQNVLGIDQAGINRLLAGAAVEGTGGGGGGQAQAASPLQGLGAGLLNSGIKSFTSGIDNLFT